MKSVRISADILPLRIFIPFVRPYADSKPPIRWTDIY